jgi:hypothetical protein
MAKKKSNLKSTCCKSEIKYSDFAPDFIGDNPKTMKIGTVSCLCTKCGEPCNIYLKNRKTWKINPATKVKGDERAKIKEKEIKKQIQEIGHA